MSAQGGVNVSYSERRATLGNGIEMQQKTPKGWRYKGQTIQPIDSLGPPLRGSRRVGCP